jgi:hypothetical protein
MNYYKLRAFRVDWWAHCFPGDEGFALPEFRKGLDWFLSHTNVQVVRA